MDRNQIVKLRRLIEQNRQNDYEIISKKVTGKKIYNFHRWANDKRYEGAFLISNKEGQSYWFLLSEWKPKRFYLILFPENRNNPIIEIPKVIKTKEKENLVWNYKPTKRDGNNDKRVAKFKRYYLSTSANISFPDNKNEMSDFYDEIFWLLEIKIKSDILDDIEPDEEYVFPEGKKRQRIHITRERNQKIAKLAKEEFKRKDKRLFCEICKFDFQKKYGKIGEGFIEAHHTLPLSLITEEQSITRIQDLAMVCSNCHKMIHRTRPWLSMKELKSLLLK